MMKLFLRKILNFSLFSIISYSVFYFIIFQINTSTKSINSIYFFGDSQIVQGINLPLITKITNTNSYSAAVHGAGVYDFYTFIDQVPDSSKIVLSISKLALIRPDINEANKAPLSFKALKALYSQGYNTTLKKIAREKIKPPLSSYFKINFNLYPNNESIVVTNPLSDYKERYLASESFLRKKQKLYLNGINKLITKNCKIVFVEFPFHKILNDYEHNFTVRHELSNFKIKISELFPKLKIDSIKLPNKKNYMYDYTHLNEYGANSLTKILGGKLNKNYSEKIYVFH